MTYKDAAGMWNEDFWKPYIGAIVNLVTNIVLVKLIGIEGVMISTIIVMLFIYFPWETSILFKKLFKRSSIEYLLKIFIHTVITIIVMVITYLFCGIVKFDGMVELIIKAFICVILPNLIFVLLYFRTEEFKVLINKLNGLINKNK